MTPAALRTLLDNIVTEIGSVADIGGGIAPQFLPAIVIGKAVAKQIPGLAEAVDNWIQGNPPTQAELDEKAAKLAVLDDPNLP